MKIQLSWVRKEFPRGVKPLAQGTNTLVFEDPDPTKVIVFMLCPVKYDWWKRCDLITNPYDDHIFSEHVVRGWRGSRRVTKYLTLRRVQAKRLFKAKPGTPQRKEILKTVRAMEDIWFSIPWHTDSQRRNELFWDKVYNTELPTAVLADFAMDYFAVPDLGPRNALVDADGQIVWSDLLIDEDIMDFVHMTKGKG